MSSRVSHDESTKVSGSGWFPNVQPRNLNNNVPKQEPGRASKDIIVEPSTTAVTTPEKLIHCVMYRLWKHLMASSTTELSDKLNALTELIDYWERKDVQQAAFETKPLVQCKKKIQQKVETPTDTSSDSFSEYSIDIKLHQISEMMISRSKKFKSSHVKIGNCTNFEKTNHPRDDMKTFKPIAGNRLMKESKELTEIATKHSLLVEDRLRNSRTVSGFLARQQRLMPFSVKSESNQIKDMLRWLAVPNTILEQVINSKYKIRKEDFKCDPENLRDSFLDNAVNIELLKPYLENSTLRVLNRVIDEKKAADVWSCGCCSERVVSRAIFCDECLIWFHYKCVSLSSTPSKNANWFCPACSKND